IAGLIVHYLYGGIRIEEGAGITVERSARFHVLIFAAVYMLLQGGRYWLKRYGTLQDQSGKWAGALYTDINAVIPTSTIFTLAAEYLLLQGGRYWPKRYCSLQDHSGKWAVALYTYIHAVIPSSSILGIAAILVIVLFVAFGINGRCRLSIIGVAGFLVAA